MDDGGLDEISVRFVARTAKDHLSICELSSHNRYNPMMLSNEASSMTAFMKWLNSRTSPTVTCESMSPMRSPDLRPQRFGDIAP